MITDIPSASEFHAAGLNQLYLAWQIALRAVYDHEDLVDYSEFDDDDAEAAAAEYWAKSQPALANAFGLTQQAMEMAMKGRIAAVSPYLLISRDPKDWPKGVDSGRMAFSEFRTLDAADLIKVHNSFATAPLDQAFRQFWDQVRRDRNKIMHSVAPKAFDPAELVRTILRAASALFGDVAWPEQLAIMESEGTYAAYGLDDNAQNAVMRQIDTAIRHLTPAESRDYFGFDPKQRAYVCPKCYFRSNRDWQESWPKLAQFQTKEPGSTGLHCVVCRETTDVERSNCADPDCKGDVLHEDLCLTCMRTQSDPSLVVSEVESDAEFGAPRYRLSFHRGKYGSGGLETSDTRHFGSDEAAVEYARTVMLSPNMLTWDTVSVSEDLPGNDLVDPLHQDRLLGSWIRGAELGWRRDWAPIMDLGAAIKDKPSP